VNFFEGKKPLCPRVISPQTPLFPNFLTLTSIEYTGFVVKVFGKRGVKGEREPFFLLKQHTAYSKRVSLPLKIPLFEPLLKSLGISDSF